MVSTAKNIPPRFVQGHAFMLGPGRMGSTDGSYVRKGGLGWLHLGWVWMAILSFERDSTMQDIEGMGGGGWGYKVVKSCEAHLISDVHVLNFNSF